MEHIDDPVIDVFDLGSGDDGTPPAEVDQRTPVERVEDALSAFADGEVRALEVAYLTDTGRAATDRLAAAWPSLPEETRVAVARWMNELAEDRVELNFGRSLRVALDDPSAVVRQLAVAGLWEDEGRDLPPILLRLLRADPSQDVRAEAAQGMGRFAVLAAGGDDVGMDADRLRDVLLDVAADEAEPSLLRRRALEAVAVFGAEDSEIADLIEEAYDGDDPGLRAGSVFAMGRTLDPRWSSTILAELRSDDAELRYEAARSAGELGDEAAVTDLADLVEDEDAEVRVAAIAALGHIGGRSAVRVLRALADRADGAETEAVAAALEEAVALGDPLRVNP